MRPEHPNIQQRFEEKFIPCTESGCWLWLSSVTDKNYGLFWHKGKYKLAHRFSYGFYKGNIPEGLCVLHKCDVSQCVNPDHLWLGTYKDNTQDMWKKGRDNNHKETHFKPNNAGHATLTPSDVKQIKELLKEKTLTLKEIGNKFKVSKQAVWRIKHNLSWTWLCL